MSNKYNYIEWRLEASSLKTYQTMNNSIFNNKLIIETAFTVNTVPERIEYFVNGEIWFRVYTGSVLACVKIPALIKLKYTRDSVLLKLRTLGMVE